MVSDLGAHHTCTLMLSYRCIVCHTLCMQCKGRIMHGPVRKQHFIANCSRLMAVLLPACMSDEGQG